MLLCDLVEIGVVCGCDYVGNLCYLIFEGEYFFDVMIGLLVWVKLVRMIKELCIGVWNNEYLVVLKMLLGVV